MTLSNLPKVPKLICGILIQVSLTLKRNVVMEEEEATREQIGNINFHLGNERRR